MRERFGGEGGGGGGEIPRAGLSYLFPTAGRLALIRDLPREKPRDGVFRGRVKCINPNGIKPAITRPRVEIKRAGESEAARSSGVINTLARMKEETFRETFPRERDPGLLNAEITGPLSGEL